MTNFAEAYIADADAVIARGIVCVTEAMPVILAAVAAKVWDREGLEVVRRVLEEAATTDFATERVADVLGREVPIEDWRAGEGIAEAYLEQEQNCRFPWPALRDLRNWRASGAGADLVGLHTSPDGIRLAFGEVKTSTEQRWPPGVATSRSGGLTNQLEELRDSLATQETLLRYLAIRADGAPWQTLFQEAAGRYLDDDRYLSLFGVLVRDVEPRREDLVSRALALAQGLREPMSVFLAAIYLPAESIAALPNELRTYGRQT
jgi:hypothetical protein